MRRVPETANRSDWPRLIAQAINDLIGVITGDKPFVFSPSDEPDDPSEGQVYFDSASKKLRVYDGTAWQDLF